MLQILGAAGCLFTWAETPRSGPTSYRGRDTITALLASTVTGYFLSCFPLQVSRAFSVDLNFSPTFLLPFLTRFQSLGHLKCGRILSARCIWQRRRCNGEAIKGGGGGTVSRDPFHAVKAAQLSWLTRARLQTKTANIDSVSSRWKIFTEDQLRVKHSPTCCAEL